MSLKGFPEDLLRIKSNGVLGAPICAYENRSTRQLDHFELRLHCTMSFAHKLALMFPK